MTLSSWKVCCARIPQRWVFAVMGCLAVTNAYTMRICLSLAITEMVIKTEAVALNDTSSDEACPSISVSTSSSSSTSATFNWDEHTHGIILSSFFWGFVITQIPGGLLAEKFGGKYILGLGIFSASICALSTPTVVYAYGATVRKIFNTISSIGPAIFIISASYSGCERTVVVTLFIIGVGMMGANYTSLMVNPNDLSPNYSGTLMASASGIGSLSAIVALYLVGVLTPNQELTEWRIVFWITSVLFTVSALVFNVWGDGGVQYWNDLSAWTDQQKEMESRTQADEYISPSKYS